MRDDFCVIILSHGRADCVKTLEPLLNAGHYSGKWFILIDNEDDQCGEYESKYGDHVIQFDKEAEAETTDTGELGNERRSCVFARNHCFKLAKGMGFRYFLMLDDDYTSFMYRFPDKGKFGYTNAKNLDDLFSAMIEFLDASGAITVAFAQGGDFIGGIDNKNFSKGLLRKAMNTFFCDVEKPFEFVGRMNSDVSTYVTLSQRGKMLFTVTAANITQIQTQQLSGGVSEVYADTGTYLKSFFSVMYAPSCVSISTMGEKHKRIHHQVNWEHCAPKIINERWKKSDNGNKDSQTSG